jgi:protein TonB
MQTAKAAPSGPEVKTDHRWLAESLWRRVAELKRYPNSARLNGQEGKVILKAVIRSDGHLIDVTVQKSSGHQILDAAAVEAVKLACPLHMKHAINKPEIVVSLPIVYSLAN